MSAFDRFVCWLKGHDFPRPPDDHPEEAFYYDCVRCGQDWFDWVSR